VVKKHFGGKASSDDGIHNPFDDPFEDRIHAPKPEMGEDLKPRPKITDMPQLDIVPTEQEERQRGILTPQRRKPARPDYSRNN
jgi:hypothetical protein